MADIVMPRLSDTMEEGTILRWLKRDGEQVRRGEELVEIETDKATMTYESDQEGVLQTVAGEGDTLAVGELIAHVVGRRHPDGPQARNGEPAQAGPAAAARRPRAGAAGGRRPTGLAARAGVRAGRRARARRARQGLSAGTADRARERRRPARRSRAAARAGGSSRPTCSARARSRAADGARRRPASAPRPPRPSVEDVATAKGETTTVELSRTQQTIARRMAESKATIPDFTLQADVDMEDCVKLRAELEAALAGRTRPRTTTWSSRPARSRCASTRARTAATATGAFELHSRVNVGVAVAAEDALVVPTVFDADEKSLGEIARETRALAERVRAGTITPPELGGGTFTVSNLGMYGVSSFTAIINPPQAAILSVGSVEPRAVVREGELVARHTMTLTLACDHRILYGADAAPVPRAHPRAARGARRAHAVSRAKSPARWLRRPREPMDGCSAEAQKPPRSRRLGQAGGARLSGR